MPVAPFRMMIDVFRPADVTVDDSPLIPFFSLGMCIWAILFVQFWDRSAAWYSCEWGIPHDLAHHDEVRLDFWGETRTSPVTGKPEVHFSATRRWVRYGVSTLVTCLMLGVAFTVMILSLNLQGYVHEKSPVRVDALSRFAEPGEIFDPNATFTSLIPVILHTIVIMFLNGQYRSVAETLTEWENHKTVHDHENALIIKRFLFEVCRHARGGTPFVPLGPNAYEAQFSCG